MPSFLKALLIVLSVLAVLAVIIIGSGVFLWKKHGKGLIETGKQTISEAQEFGGKTDNNGCVKEALSRHLRSKGLAGTIRNSIFLQGCLRASEPTPGFCENVPKTTDIMQTIQWRLAQCANAGLQGDDECSSLFQQVQHYCEKNSQ